MPGSSVSGLDQFRELHERLIELIGPLAKFLQGVEGEYLEARANKVEVKHVKR